MGNDDRYKGERASKGTERCEGLGLLGAEWSSEGTEWASDGTRWALEPAGRALEPAGMTSEPVRRALGPAGRAGRTVGALPVT